MSKIRTSIPIHSLQGKNKLGFEITKLSNIDSTRLRQNTAHRDDHYIFFFQEKGACDIMIDFEHVSLKAHHILYILPGQVHHAMSATNSYTWVISLDASLLNMAFKPTFDTLLLKRSPIPLESDKEILLNNGLAILDNLYKKIGQTHFLGQIIRGTIDLCIGVFASAYYEFEEQQGLSNGRPSIIMRQFKILLTDSFRTLKSPSGYAGKLNITPAYLSEVVKQVSGFTVSYWIHQQIITEAKRTLYYTDLTVKEVAYLLGYEDHTYFSRLFTKYTGMSAIQFRTFSRK